jgi:hypothetical protein
MELININLDLLKFQIETKRENNHSLLFDPVRKKWIALSPEELVRQHFIQYLLIKKKYPKSLIKLEHSLRLNNLNKRSDIVVYSRQGIPWLLVECKKHEVVLDDKVLLQALRYHVNLNVKYIVITNGINTYCFEVNENKIFSMDNLPMY